LRFSVLLEVQQEVCDFMGDCKSLPDGRMRGVIADHAALVFDDEHARHIFPERRGVGRQVQSVSAMANMGKVLNVQISGATAEIEQLANAGMPIELVV
jgi:hypothetical protein